MWHAWGEKKSKRHLMGNYEGKRPIGRPMRRWEDNVTWFLKGYDGIVCTGLISDGRLTGFIWLKKG
jgi:hypothetical protein